MSQSHSFCVEDAQLYGVECAILINHFRFWINQNSACKRNFFDGRTWMFQTQKEIAAIYPYWSEDQVQRNIKKLLDMGVIIKGNYNKSSYDRTVWYAFKVEEISTIPQNRGMESAKTRNQIREVASPIPDTNKDTNKDLPPLTPPKVLDAKVKKKKDEEDFSFLSSFNFTEHEKRQLREFSSDQVKRAIEISKHQTVKSSLVGLLLNILRNPEKWPDPKELENKKKCSVINSFDYAPFNSSYWTQILHLVTQTMIREMGTIKAAQGWNSKGLRECGSYLQDPHGEKIYMKDHTFLDQIRNYFLKKGIELKSLYDFIDQCKQDLGGRLKSL